MTLIVGYYYFSVEKRLRIATSGDSCGKRVTEYDGNAWHSWALMGSA